jgi:hypothetical protein
MPPPSPQKTRLTTCSVLPHHQCAGHILPRSLAKSSLPRLLGTLGMVLVGTMQNRTPRLSPTKWSKWEKAPRSFLPFRPRNPIRWHVSAELCFPLFFLPCSFFSGFRLVKALTLGGLQAQRKRGPTQKGEAPSSWSWSN